MCKAGVAVGTRGLGLLFQQLLSRLVELALGVRELLLQTLRLLYLEVELHLQDLFFAAEICLNILEVA